MQPKDHATFHSLANTNILPSGSVAFKVRFKLPGLEIGLQMANLQKFENLNEAPTKAAIPGRRR